MVAEGDNLVGSLQDEGERGVPARAEDLKKGGEEGQKVNNNRTLIIQNDSAGP